MAGGCAILVAGLLELILILRMAIANMQVAFNSVDSTLGILNLQVIKVEVQTPYSIILAGIGLLFIILGMVSSRNLYSRTRDQSTDGQSISPVRFTIHQDND
ncbi:uncharacterized protein LOC133195888 [Saccostrea echinata]|uniref:uncharacterized protein LOC133195888 n=1 Tax=Saccostrea echinata TaxID=191078 RepID=UPI002A7F4591|nr:uncharacterized protein LOC133195888 [Saccostrea echinata]